MKNENENEKKVDIQQEWTLNQRKMW